jgi:hypothetical protein
MTDPVVRAMEGALRILGAETRTVAEALLDAAPTELTDHERSAILARFATAAGYDRGQPATGASLPPGVGGYSLGHRWPHMNGSPGYP